MFQGQPGQIVQEIPSPKNQSKTLVLLALQAQSPEFKPQFHQKKKERGREGGKEGRKQGKKEERKEGRKEEKEGQEG
jgi:hypothetical protein